MGVHQQLKDLCIKNEDKKTRKLHKRQQSHLPFRTRTRKRGSSKTEHSTNQQLEKLKFIPIPSLLSSRSTDTNPYDHGKKRNFKKDRSKKRVSFNLKPLTPDTPKITKRRHSDSMISTIKHYKHYKDEYVHTQFEKQSIDKIRKELLKEKKINT